MPSPSPSPKPPAAHSHHARRRGPHPQPITVPDLEVSMSVRPVFLPLADLLTELATHGDCRHDPDLHMGPDAFEDEPPADRRARQDVAREVCESCPVWDLCLDYAMRIPPAHGVWAGLLPYELAALRREARALSASDLSAPDLEEVA
ncbi:WhiB family transcriptional regulator [Actinomadura montaniterrae]|uniref:WhiB family transcriptional regulator n=2 Tax=Actinomadura montaniterrae TaxID=1803903 RepID=A0A6L3VT52_9ACTN|nr:WhiB family transcriptional regulator [Actinomadura montaniterrae]